MSVFSNQTRADIWSTGYYPGYEQASLPASAIDYGGLTHIVHFALLPGPNGAVDATTNVLTQANVTNLIYYTHLAGKKALICLGGAGSTFAGVSNTTYLNNLVANTVSFMHTNGYDGIDLDWEPVTTNDVTTLTNLVVKLRTALNAISPRPLLTIAMPATVPDPTTGPSIMQSVKDQFDQFNLQTYDFSGPYGGWFTWFNSPIYDGGAMFPNNGGTPPSIDGMVNLYLSYGFATNKLGIGMAFEGFVWAGGQTTTNTDGVSVPRQQWKDSFVPTVSFDVPYTTLAAQYGTNLYHWDTNAQAAYFSVTNQGANNKFVSFDDARAVQSKVSYARNKGLGGVILFELGLDHPASGPDPLLQAVKQALNTPGAMNIQRSGQSNTLSFTSAPLGSYRVQWRTNAASGTWNSLFTTNETGVGGTKQFSDPVVSGQPARFYRVQTPQ